MNSQYPLAHKIIIPKPYSREATVAQTIARERERLAQMQQAYKATNVRTIVRSK